MAYIDTENIPLHMPVPGTREPAQIALLNENSVTLSNHDHTTGKGLAIGRLRSGTQANRPPAASAGSVYFATDTGKFYVDTGTAWVEFITSGGQATVTGWTLVDPIIRDTLQFGPEGSATIDNFLSRTGASALRTDSNLGVGVAPEAWGADWGVLRFGQGGSLFGQKSSPGGFLGGNAYHDGTAWRTAVAGGASYLQAQGGAVYLATAPSVAAGATLTFTNRLVVDQAGIATHTSDVGVPAIKLGAQAALGWGGTGANAPVFMQFGRSGAIVALDTNEILNLSSNLRNDGTANRVLAAGRPVQMSINGNIGAWGIYIATATAAGADAAMVQRIGVDANGMTAFVPVNVNATAIQAYGNIMAVGVEGQPETVRLGSAYSSPGVYSSNRLFLQGEGQVTLRSLGAGVSIIGTGPCLVQMTAPYLQPATDAGQNLGYPSTGRWANLYIYYAPTVGSHASMKENFAPLDPVACAQAVLNTDWISYDYLQQPPPERREGEADEAYQQRLDEHQKVLEATDYSRHQKGYALGHPEYRVADLFGLSNRADRSDGADLAVIACALQSALQRIAALEAASGQPATSA